MRIAFLIASLALVAVPAAADDSPARVLLVVNDTSAPVNQLFVRGGKRGLKAKVGRIFKGGEDDNDRLGAKLLPRGGSIAVQLADERCEYELTAVLEDGRTYVARTFDACSQSRWSISTGALE